MRTNSQYKTIKWLILSSLMAGALTACPDTGTGQASFEVTGASLGSSFVDGTSIQPAEAIVKNTSGIAGTPPQVSFNITSDILFVSLESSIYTCDQTSEVLVTCTANDGAKLEGQTETSLKPLFDLAFQNVPITPALQVNTRQAVSAFTLPVSISSNALTTPIALAASTVTAASALPYDLSIDKKVSKDFIVDGSGNGSGEFEITSTIVSGTPPYITIQDPPLPIGYKYNVPLLVSLNSPFWNCSFTPTSGLGWLICKAVSVTNHPILRVPVTITNLNNLVPQKNCPRIRDFIGDTDPTNNHLGAPGFYKLCTPYQPIKTDLAITKTQIAPLTNPANSFYWGLPGQYQIVVKNNSGPAVSTVTVQDVLTNLPGGAITAFTASSPLVSTASATAGWTCAPTFPTLTCTYSGSPVPAGQSFPPLVLNVNLKPQDSSLADGEINCATLVNKSPTGALTPFNDANNQNNSSCVTSQNDPLLPFDLEIKKSHSNQTVAPGGVVNYSIIVTNNGTGDAPGPIKITDTLPAAFSSGSAVFVPSSAGTCTPAPTIICTSNSSLAAGSNYIISVTATTNANATGNITNIATVSSYLPVGETTLVNNTSSDTLTLTNPQTKSDLAIVKKHEPVSYKPGDFIHYFLTVTNNGLQTVTGAIVTDTLPSQFIAPVTATVSPLTAGTCNVLLFPTITCTANPLAPGQSFTVTINAATDSHTTPGTAIKNTATVSSPNNVDPVPANDSFTDVLTLVQGCTGINANLNKTLYGNVLVAGATAYYNFQFSNPCGPITSGPVTITDTLQNGLTRFDTVWSGPWSCDVSNPPTITCTYTGSFPIPSGYTSTNNIAIGVNIPNTPGVAIQNCATVNVPGDANLADNTSCITNTTVVSNP
jgi:uncharacterized repeat protein (TIGR01451 family)